MSAQGMRRLQSEGWGDMYADGLAWCGVPFRDTKQDDLTGIFMLILHNTYNNSIVNYAG